MTLKLLPSPQIGMALLPMSNGTQAPAFRKRVADDPVRRGRARPDRTQSNQAGSPWRRDARRYGARGRIACLRRVALLRGECCPTKLRNLAKTWSWLKHGFRGRTVAVDSDSRGSALGFQQTARRKRELATAGLTPKLFYPIRFL